MVFYESKRNYRLSQNYKELAKELNQSMDLVNLDPCFIKNLPELKKTLWQGRDFNCYNFALGNRTEEFVQPGFVDRRDDTKMRFATPREYFNFVYDMIPLGQGRDLGKEFHSAVENLKPDENISALFFRKIYDGQNYAVDFHWMALKQEKGDAVWAHKPGPTPVQVIDKTKDIFSEAAASNYGYFVGYFAHPKYLANLDETPVLDTVKGAAQMALNYLKNKL